MKNIKEARSGYKGKPIVYIHGYCDTKDSFTLLRQYFPDGIAYDLPGFGAEEKLETIYDKNLFVSFLRKKVTKKSVLIGFSMGALVVKDFAILYPDLVEKAFLISYPLQKSEQALKKAMQSRRLGRHYVDKTIWGKLLCSCHWLYRWLVIFYVNLFRRRYRYAIRGWFEHTYQSALSTMQDYIIKNNPMELKKLKDKAVIIVGEHEDLVDKSLLAGFKSYLIPQMDHSMFGYEKEIANIIKENV